MFSTLLNNLVNLLTQVWPFILAGGILSPIAAGINKLIKAQKPITKFLVVFLGASIITLVHAFLNTKSTDANIVAVQSALITFFATPFYLVLVKPGFQWLGEQWAKAAAFDAQMKSAAVPPAPVTETPPVAEALPQSFEN